MDIKSLIELSKTNKLVFDPPKEMLSVEALYSEDTARDITFILNEDQKILKTMLSEVTIKEIHNEENLG